MHGRKVCMGTYMNAGVHAVRHDRISAIYVCKVICARMSTGACDHERMRACHEYEHTSACVRACTIRCKSTGARARRSVGAQRLQTVVNVGILAVPLALLWALECACTKA